MKKIFSFLLTIFMVFPVLFFSSCETKTKLTTINYANYIAVNKTIKSIDVIEIEDNSSSYEVIYLVSISTSARIKDCTFENVIIYTSECVLNLDCNGNAESSYIEIKKEKSLKSNLVESLSEHNKYSVTSISGYIIF